MPTKIIMRWDILPETESEYFEFLVHEYIPALNKMGISEIQVWYTQFGDCEQKLASGTTESKENMIAALNSDEWEKLMEQLDRFVENFEKKVVPATSGFQI